MKSIIKGKMKSVAGLLALGLLPLCGATTAWAKDHSGSEAVAVVSNASFDGKLATDMELEQQSGKSYLRILFAAGQQAQVLDVTKPENGLEAVAPAVGEQRTAINESLVLVRAGTPDASGPSVNQEFTLWDLSQARHPRLVQKFTAVHRVIEDGRGYVYVLHDGGLSVIKSKKRNDQDSRWPGFEIYG